MTTRTTRSQTINLTMSVNDFSVNETMINNSSNLTKSFFFSVIVFFVLINEDLQNAQMQNFFFFSKSIFENEKKRISTFEKNRKKNCTNAENATFEKM